MPAPWSMVLERLFAAAYDPVLHRLERRGLRASRAALLGDLTGDVLEIGAGTGLNLCHYGSEARVTLLEPSVAMRDRLRARAGDQQVVDGTAEALPFPDATFDVVVSGFVLCSVQDASRSLVEIHRVLRPGGRLVFLEHVASRSPWIHALQRSLNPAWRLFTQGCHLCRDTEGAILDGGFQLERIDRSPLQGGFLLIEEAIRGVARRQPPPSEGKQDA